MHILGGLLLVGMIVLLVVWGLVWFVVNFWPWILGVGITWLVLWFIWPDFRFWWTAEGIRAAHQRAMRKADQICDDTIDSMDRVKEDRS